MGALPSPIIQIMIGLFERFTGNNNNNNNTLYLKRVEHLAQVLIYNVPTVIRGLYTNTATQVQY